MEASKGIHGGSLWRSDIDPNRSSERYVLLNYPGEKGLVSRSYLEEWMALQSDSTKTGIAPEETEGTGSDIRVKATKCHDPRPAGTLVKVEKKIKHTLMISVQVEDEILVSARSPSTS
jgi:hypothetical protein